MASGGTLELISLSPTRGESINYDRLLFKIGLLPRVDVENSGDLLVMLTTMINGGARKILIDMSSLVYIDSAGIGILINAAKLLKTKRGEIAFSGVAAEINKLFKVINLHGFIHIFNLEGEAINHFRYF